MLTLVVLLTPATRSELEHLLQRRTTVSVDIAWRVRMVLLRADAITITKPMADTLGRAA